MVCGLHPSHSADDRRHTERQFTSESQLLSTEDKFIFLLLSVKVIPKVVIDLDQIFGSIDSGLRTKSIRF